MESSIEGMTVNWFLIISFNNTFSFILRLVSRLNEALACLCRIINNKTRRRKLCFQICLVLAKNWTFEFQLHKTLLQGSIMDNLTITPWTKMEMLSTIPFFKRISFILITLKTYSQHKWIHFCSIHSSSKLFGLIW